MAVGTFQLYTSVMDFIHTAQDGGDVDSATMCFSIVGTGYTPSLAHSDYATQVGAQEISAHITSGARTLTNVTWTASSTTAYYLKADNPIVTAGDTMTAKYAIVYFQAGQLIGYADLETGGSTVDATQITYKFNGSDSAGTVFKVKNG